jgi:hypothetical protein
MWKNSPSADKCALGLDSASGKLTRRRPFPRAPRLLPSPPTMQERKKKRGNNEPAAQLLPPRCHVMDLARGEEGQPTRRGSG